ncbi:AAA family ATPase, partial [Rhizobium ruizarguesonis]
MQYSLEQDRNDDIISVDPRMPMAPTSLEQAGLDQSFLLRLASKCAA